jgi:hypothetical protein
MSSRGAAPPTHLSRSDRARFGSTWLARAGLAAASLLLSWAAMELLVFPRLLPHLPLPLHGALGEATVILSQDSKGGLFPEDWVAILGDSHAVGVGDCAAGGSPARGDCPGVADHLHAATGRDVIALAAVGAGSPEGLLSEPAAQLRYGQALSGGRLRAPEVALLLFYEGNDIEDNLAYLTQLYLPQATHREAFWEPSVFEDFVRQQLLESHPYWRAAESLGPLDRLHFLRSMRSLARAITEGGVWQQPPEPPGLPRPLPPGEEMAVMVGGRAVIIPHVLEGPALAAEPHEITTALRELRLSLSVARRWFPDTRFGVVYVPSPLGSYQLAREGVTVEDSWQGTRPTRYDSAAVTQRSDTIAAGVQAACTELSVPFADSRPALREASRQGLLHGPTDWRHPNEQGYAAIARVALELLGRMEPPGSDGAGQD